MFQGELVSRKNEEKKTETEKQSYEIKKKS